MKLLCFVLAITTFQSVNSILTGDSSIMPRQFREPTDTEVKSEIDRIHSLKHFALEAEFLDGKFNDKDLPQLLNVFFYQLLNEMFFFNANDCAFYIYNVADKLYLAQNEVFGDKFSLMNGVQYMFTAVHISPIAF
jgi:hypothetical protein